MHNTSFAPQIDEVVHPRRIGDSFLKIFASPRSDLSSSAPGSTTGFPAGDVTMQLRNIGDESVTFKVQAALRNCAAQNQAGDTPYEDVTDLTSVTVVAGGYHQVAIPMQAKNLFRFELLSGGPSRLRVAVACVAPISLWKSNEVESERATHLDTFLQDEEPKDFYSNSSPTSEDYQ